MMLNQKGSSMVEVMIALFILAIGLLGVLAMQTKSMQFNQSAQNYSKAVYVATDIVERLRKNASSADDYLTANAVTEEQGPPGTACNEPASTCSGAQLAAWDLYEISVAVAPSTSTNAGANKSKLLPYGAFKIEELDRGGVTYHVIEVRFDDSRANSDGETLDPKIYRLITRLNV